MIERLHKGNYLLLRIGIERTWLEQLKLPGCLEVFSRPQEELPQEEPDKEQGASFWQRRKEKKRRLELQRQLKRQRENERQALLEKVKELSALVLPMTDFPGESYVVYDDVLCRKSFPLLWQKICDFPEFDGYLGEQWAELLLPYATKTDYLVLGCSGLLQDYLWSKGIRMKSLTWILPRHLYMEDVKQFEEDFLYEYGLAIDMQIIQSETEYRKIPLVSRSCINVLDFSGEDKLNVTGLQPESIWLDMSSSEQKKRRIEASNPQISYISLKNMWKEAKKDGIVLDTISKNRYNT